MIFWWFSISSPCRTVCMRELTSYYLLTPLKLKCFYNIFTIRCTDNDFERGHRRITMPTKHTVALYVMKFFNVTNLVKREIRIKVI